jgi:4'-phosphopantetheinyl transferase
MDVYWFEQSIADIPAEDDWLSEREQLHLSGFRILKRRDDWRLGRWTAKLALALFFEVPAHPPLLAKIEVVPAASGAPEVLFSNVPAPVTISLTHSSCRAACLLAAPGIDLGCDLELIEPRSDAFIRDYFTDEEQRFIQCAGENERSQLATLLWSAKESALKALHEGLRMNTRTLAVHVGEMARVIDGWRALEVRNQERLFRGWWRESDGMVQTMVADPLPNPPVLLPLDSSGHARSIRIRVRDETEDKVCDARS